MKKAVLFSNHFRAFDYTVDYFLEYFGPDTDYYICCWDTEYDFYNVNELVNNLATTNTISSGYTAQEQYKIDKAERAFKPLSIENAESAILSKLPNAKITWVSNNDFFEWINTVKIQKNTDKYSNLYKLGFFYILQRGYNYFFNKNTDYDLVFRARFDCIPYEKKWQIKENTIFTNSFKLNEGVIWADESFFYGTPGSFLKLFSNYKDKLEELTNTSPFKHQFEKLLFQKLFGSLVVLSELGLRESNVSTAYVRKEVVDRKKNLLNKEELDKISWLYQYLQRSLKWKQQ